MELHPGFSVTTVRLDVAHATFTINTASTDERNHDCRGLTRPMLLSDSKAYAVALNDFRRSRLRWEFDGIVVVQGRGAVDVPKTFFQVAEEFDG